MADILFVDDNAVTRKLIRNVLERAGHKVSLAPDGLSGLAMLVNRKYDLLIFDLMMPKMSGIEMVTEAKKRGLLTCPAVAYTALADPVWVRSLDAVSAVLPKPVDEGEFLSVVERQLGNC